MREVDQVRLLRPGQMPKAVEWNAIVRQLQAHQPTRAGYDGAHGLAYHKEFTPYRQPILLYSSVDIPAYSVFPIKIRTGEDEFFEVCEFDKTKISEYVDGYWATNGQYEITKEIPFYGYLLDENHDDPIAICGNPNVGDECGLSERAEFKADPDAQGMIITGVFSTGVYYVRKMNRFPDFFATLNEDYTVEDGTYTSVTLEDPETFIGESTIEKVYPAWNIDPETQFDAETRVIVRFDTKRGKWFFFKPTGGGVDGKVLLIYGNPLSVVQSSSTSPAHDTVTEPIFYTEMAAGEEVASDLLITAVSKTEDATGSETSNAWNKFPTDFITAEETPVWWRKNGVELGSHNLYQYLSGGTYHATTAEYYGKVIQGSSVYYLPKYRLINGQRYWVGNGSPTEYIYCTQKDGDDGWAIGETLGKFLVTGDTETFYSETDATQGGYNDALEMLMDQESLTYAKPEWTCNSEFGVYSANASALAIWSTVNTIQLGCGRWTASDGRTLQNPFYFVHVCDGTIALWKGVYECQAFGEKFNQITYSLDATTEQYKYFLGNKDSGNGCYISDSAPSTSSAITFTYRPGSSGLKGILKYVSMANNTETWEMQCGSDKATYTCAEGATTLTYQSTAGNTGTYYFRNITKSNDTWTAAGVDGTVGTLVFSGADLSKETGNDFVFNHSISLTFTDYVQGSETRKVYMCSPGVFS